MTQETFLNYGSLRWMWLHLLLLTALVVGYCLYNPLGPMNGGTVLGYAYGAVATVGIVILMWYARRKRDYFARFTTLRGWLAVHVWLGLSLLVVVPLHSGFQFGVNVHTLAYLLLVLTVLTGVWGAWIFIDLAPNVSSHRGGGTAEDVLEQIVSISKDSRTLIAQRSDKCVALFEALDTKQLPSFWGSVWGSPPEELNREKASVWLADLPDAEVADGQKLVGLLYKKRELVRNLHHEISAQAWLKLWLYTHVPLASAMVIAVVIHILYVFYYF